MAEFHPLRSLETNYSKANNSVWSIQNAKAEKRAKEIPCATMPSLDHLKMKDFEQVYEPSDDTYLLLDGLKAEVDDGNLQQQQHCTTTTSLIIVEIGCGSGVVSTFLASYLRVKSNNKETADTSQMAAEPPPMVIVTDINPRALQVTQATAAAAAATTTTTTTTASNNNNLLPIRLEAIQCDLLSSLLPRLQHTVDVIIFNPPYVPTPDDEVGSVGIEASWAGGLKGRRVIDRAISQIAEALAKPMGVAYMITVDDNEPQQLAVVFRQFGLDMTPLVRRRAHNEFLTVQKIQWITQQRDDGLQSDEPEGNS